MATDIRSISEPTAPAVALRQAASDPALAPEICCEAHRLMVLARVLEERMIKMSKSGEGFFWVGGPGEEAFNVALGLQVKQGRGPQFDYLHLHYRSAAVALAMGQSPVDLMRQMASVATDPYSAGRNFVGHLADPACNILPVSSTVGTQFAVAPGTALMQKRHGGDGVSIVIGGDAGTAEGDFATCMIWSTRPGCELPVLMVVTNNAWGISTPARTQHGERRIIDRGVPFGIPGEVVNGNDLFASWQAVSKALHYCRTQRRPYLLEANVARLYGHSSSSGAVRVEGEPDCIVLLEKKLLQAGWATHEQIRETHTAAQREIEAALALVMSEPRPRGEDAAAHTYAASGVDAVYPRDYSGLPGR